MAKSSKKAEYHSVFISDIHLGTKMCQEDKLLDFLGSFKTNNLVLVGDILDLWSLNRKHVWSKTQTEILRKILKLSEKSEVSYFPGNHDGVVRKFIQYNDGVDTFGSILLGNSLEYCALDGKNILITHGDQFDWAMRIPPFLFGKLDGLLSIFPAHRVQKLTTFVNRFTSTERVATRFIEKNPQYDAVLMGHTHIPKLTDTYRNTGDWVINCSYIVENFDGSWELLYY